MTLSHERDGAGERPLESKFSIIAERVLHDWTRCENCDRLARAGGCGHADCPLLYWHPTDEQGDRTP